MKNLSYTLWQIASWTFDESEVLIPALQRGLVWKPRQVELLWDSILRGFPIGSFMLSDIVNKEGLGKYYLMDGQQRYNAISIGFNTVKAARAVLWIDLLPPSSKNSTRSFWIKATTTPHPWGYKNDDDANRLNTAEKRKALKEFNLKGNIYNDHFSLAETWPIEANLPIPLFCLLKATEKTSDADNFVKEVFAEFNSTDFSYRFYFIEKIKHSNVALTYLRDVLFPAFNALKDYMITCNHLPKEVMETETTEETMAQTTLEVLFTRLNTGGTAISRDDLNYSAIKAYWPSIKDVNDHLAEKYMSPSKLVMLAFRLALTSEDDKSFKGEMTIKQIRSAAIMTDERDKIESLYDNNQLEIILNKVDEWLGAKEDSVLRTPNILRTIIARNSPDVYLLLMYMARKDMESPINLSAYEIKALAFLLHWFGNDKKHCVQEIFHRFKNGINILIGENNSGKTAIIDALRICLGCGKPDNFIYVQDGDLHVNPENPSEINTVIQFDLIFEFGDASIERECFYDFISQDKDNPDKQTIQLHLKFIQENNGKKKYFKRIIWGGDNEGQQVPYESLQEIFYTYLSPLRDAVSCLRPYSYDNKTSQLFNQLTKYDKGNESIPLNEEKKKSLCKRIRNI